MPLVPVKFNFVTMNLARELVKELEIEEVFHFKIGSVTIGFDEATVVQWIIIAAMTVICFLLTRGFKVEGEISKRQALLEVMYEKAEEFFKGLMGSKVQKFIPWLMSMALFIGVSNIIGLFGFKPPTKSVQVTAAMALTSIVLIEYSAFSSKGFFGRLKAFTKPISIVTPINILEVFTKPLSLCMRLFGNVLAAFTIMEIVKIVTKNIIAPAVLSLYFDMFDGLLQAYIFVFLTALYLEESVAEEEEPKTKEQKKMEKAAKKAEKAAKRAAKKNKQPV